VRFNIAVVGTGYVGLTTGACLAHLGHDVVCVDVDESKVERLRAGQVDILEEGLKELVVEGSRAGRLRFTSDHESAVTDRHFVCLCVPSPEAPDGSADLSFIQAAAKAIAPHLTAGAVVINKSTVPVGSTRVVEEAMERDDVAVVSNPEFLREGSAVHDFLHPDRVVIGADDEAAALQLVSVYVGLAAPVVVTDPASAELIKYASNAFLATKLSFINEVAGLAEALGANIDDVVRGVGGDPRIGSNHLAPGPGWGGSCLPKDTRAMMHMANRAGRQFGLLRAVVDVNEHQFDLMADKVEELVGSLSGSRLAAWGLAFKGGTNDLRRSPALEVLARLVQRGATVLAYDPAIPAGADVLEGVQVLGDAYEVCDGADALVVLTDWPQFRVADLDRVSGLLTAPRVVDTRNLLDVPTLQRNGFAVRRVGHVSTDHA
jgi:UDPglucose 6-dehydrogenase